MEISQCNAPARGEIKNHLEEFMKWKEASGKMKEDFRKGSQQMKENLKEILKCNTPIYFEYNENLKRTNWIKDPKLIKTQEGQEFRLNIKNPDKNEKLYKIVCDFSTRSRKTFKEHNETFHDANGNNIMEKKTIDEETTQKKDECRKEDIKEKSINSDPKKEVKKISKSANKNDDQKMDKKEKMKKINTEKSSKKNSETNPESKTTSNIIPEPEDHEDPEDPEDPTKTIKMERITSVGSTIEIENFEVKTVTDILFPENTFSQENTQLSASEILITITATNQQQNVVSAENIPKNEDHVEPHHEDGKITSIEQIIEVNQYEIKTIISVRLTNYNFKEHLEDLKALYIFKVKFMEVRKEIKTNYKAKEESKNWEQFKVMFDDVLKEINELNEAKEESKALEDSKIIFAEVVKETKEEQKAKDDSKSLDRLKTIFNNVLKEVIEEQKTKED